MIALPSAIVENTILTTKITPMSRKNAASHAENQLENC